MRRRKKRGKEHGKIWSCHQAWFESTLVLEKGALAGGAVAVGAGLIAGATRAFGEESGGGLTKGDATILRLRWQLSLLKRTFGHNTRNWAVSRLANFPSRHFRPRHSTAIRLPS